MSNLETAQEISNQSTVFNVDICLKWLEIKESEWERERASERWIERQTDRQTDRQAGRQAERKRQKETE